MSKNAQEALDLLKAGKNPLENYEIVREVIITDGVEGLKFIWENIPAKILNQLRENDEANKIIKEYEKILKAELKELEKTKGMAYKFGKIEDFEKWVEKQKVPHSYNVRHTIFTHRNLYPITEDEVIEPIFNHITSKGEHLMVKRQTKDCSSCGHKSIWRPRFSKFVCSNCSEKEKKESDTAYTTEMVETVGVDFNELPSQEIYTRPVVEFLQNVIDARVREEIKITKKDAKDGSNSKSSN